VGTFGAAAQLQKSPMRHMICLESAGQPWPVSRALRQLRIFISAFAVFGIAAR